MSDKPIDRDGVGKTLIRKLGEKTDTEGFRTTSIDTVEGRVTMRTKGGMPEVTREGKQAKGCKLLPLKEIDADIPQGNTQNARLYYHDHEKDEEIPERRVFSSDGIFSLPVTPLKKILFRSKGLGSRVEVWLNDHTVPASHDDPMNAGTIEQVAPQEDPNKPAKGPVVLVEQARRDDNPGTQGVAYANDELAFKDDPDGKLRRRFYPPTFLFQPNPKESGDWGSLFGMAMVFARVKSITFNVQGIPGVRRVKAWFARHIPSIKRSQKPNGAVGEGYERDMHSRVFWKIGQAWPPPGYAQNVQTIKMNGGNVDLAPPYGVLSPLPKGYIHLLDPAEKCEVQPADGSSNYTDFARLSSVSHLLTFGQPWHGVLNPENGELRTEGGDLVTTFDPGDVDKDTSFIESLWYVNFGKKQVDLPLTTTYPSEDTREKAKLLGDAVLYNGRYTYGKDNEKKLVHRSLSLGGSAFGAEFLVRNADGTVHKMHVNMETSQARFTYCGRFDDSLIADSNYVAPASSEVALISTPFAISTALLSGYRDNHLIRFSPDGRNIYGLNTLFVISGDAGPTMSISAQQNLFDPYGMLSGKYAPQGALNTMSQTSPGWWASNNNPNRSFGTSASGVITETYNWIKQAFADQIVSQSAVGSGSGSANATYYWSNSSCSQGLLLIDVLWADNRFIAVEGLVNSYQEFVINDTYSCSTSASGSGPNAADVAAQLTSAAASGSGSRTYNNYCWDECFILRDREVVDSKVTEKATWKGIEYTYGNPATSAYMMTVNFVPAISSNRDSVSVGQAYTEVRTYSIVPTADENAAYDVFNGVLQSPVSNFVESSTTEQTGYSRGSVVQIGAWTSSGSFSTRYYWPYFEGVDIRQNYQLPPQARISSGLAYGNSPPARTPSQNIIVAGFPLTPGPGQTVHYDPRTGRPGLNNFGGVIVI